MQSGIKKKETEKEKQGYTQLSQARNDGKGLLHRLKRQREKVLTTEDLAR